MADRIDQLPPTMKTPSDIDKNAMYDIFHTNDIGNAAPFVHVANKINWKKFFIPLIVFIILSLPPINNIFLNMLSESETTTLIVKSVVFIVIMLVLQLIN